MSVNDAHPWSAVRHLAQVLFDQMKEDFPDSDTDYVMEQSLKNCKEAWTKMSREQKIKYEKLAANDKAQFGDKSDGSKSGKRKSEPQGKEKKNLEEEKVNTGSAKKQKTPKGPKDPNKPKKPMGAFFIFLNENREKIRAENPDISGDVNKKASEMFKSLSSKEKLPYEKTFKKQMADYEEAMAKYDKNHGNEK